MRVLTLSIFAAILSAPAFAADLGTYRPGTPYNNIVAPSADVCDSQCSGDAQCRGWNYVKRAPQAPGICEFLSSVSAPISSPISISGQNFSPAPYSSRLTAGGTNTIRVGSPATPQANTTRVGQSASGRRIVRQAPTQRIAPQTASTRPVENLSLTEQQNRYRQGIVAAPQAAVSAPIQRQFVPQVSAPRPVFRQHLDEAYQQPQVQYPQAQHPQNPQIQNQQSQTTQSQRQSSRRVTGPRRAPVQPNVQTQASNVQQYQAPQFQAPPYQAPQFQAPQIQAPQYQAPLTQAPAAQLSAGQPTPPLRRGSSRPPVGQPIPPSQAPIAAAPVNQLPVRPQRSTPSQRLAQLTAQTRSQTATTASSNSPISLSPEQARTSLFGRLNDDVQPTTAASSDLPVATSVPTAPVVQQELGEVLAGGL